MSEGTQIFEYNRGPAKLAIAPSVAREVIAPPFWDAEVVPRLRFVEESLPPEYREDLASPLTFWAILVWILRSGLRADVEHCEAVLRGLYSRYRGYLPLARSANSGFVHDTTFLDEKYFGLFRLQFPVDAYEHWPRGQIAEQVRLLSVFIPSFNCDSSVSLRVDAAVPRHALHLRDADFVQEVASELGISSALVERRVSSVK